MVERSAPFPRNLQRHELTGGKLQNIRALIEGGQRTLGLYGSRGSGWSVEIWDGDQISLTVSRSPYRTKAEAEADAAIAYGVRPWRVRPW